jgi:hypothetical protein
MPMAASVTRHWFAWLDGAPVVLSSPHPVSECARRLAAVTTDRGSGWYLDARTAGQPDPRFRGTVSPAWISVARFAEAIRRNSFVPWLQGRMEPSADGGTRVVGRVGPRPELRVMLAVIAAVWSIISLAALTAGLVQAAAGHLAGLLATLVPLGMAALLTGVTAAGQASVTREIPRLIGAVNGVLDSAASAPFAMER